MSNSAALRRQFRLSGSTWLSWMAIWLLGLLLLVAAVLVVRRSVGQLTFPLSPPALLACGLLVAAASITRRLLTDDGPRASEAVRTLWRVAPTIAVVLIASSLSIPGTSAAGLFLLWICTAAGEIVGQIIMQSCAVKKAEWLSHSDEKTQMPSGLAFQDAAPARSSSEADLEEDDLDVYQRLTRRRDDLGRELLSGWLRVDVAPGERTKFAHVAFCPPMRSPQCEIELEDEFVTATVAQVLPQGARFELKLPKAATEATSIAFEWVAYESDSIQMARSCHSERS